MHRELFLGLHIAVELSLSLSLFSTDWNKAYFLDLRMGFTRLLVCVCVWQYRLETYTYVRSSTEKANESRISKGFLRLFSGGCHWYIILNACDQLVISQVTKWYNFVPNVPQSQSIVIIVYSINNVIVLWYYSITHSLRVHCLGYCGGGKTFHRMHYIRQPFLVNLKEAARKMNQLLRACVRRYKWIGAENW